MPQGYANSSGLGRRGPRDGYLCGEASRSEIRDGFGTICDPFSAHRYLGFEGELSHPTLAHGDVSLTRSGEPLAGDQLTHRLTFAFLQVGGHSGPLGCCVT
jgi:hypothetical protein